jgi:hypothetical protein
MANKMLNPDTVLHVASSRGIELKASNIREFRDFHQKSVAYFRSKKRVEKFVDSIPEHLVAPLLFDLWAESYAEDMAGHTKAACAALDNYRDRIAEQAEHILSHKKKKCLVVMDPSCGPGDITKFFMEILAERIRRVPILLLLRDLSPNMLEQAQRIRWPKNTAVIRTVADFVAPANPLEERKLFETVDFMLLSQTLDVLPKYSDKSKCLAAVFSYLRVNGTAVFLGERPSRFTLDTSMDPLLAMLFRRLFQEDGWDFHRTIDQVREVANGRLQHLCGGWGRDTAIDSNHHAFVVFAEKIFRESHSGPLSRFFFIDDKGNIRDR